MPLKMKLFPARGVAFSATDGFVSEAVAAPEGMPTHLDCILGGEKKQVPLGYLDKDVIEEGQWFDPKTNQSFPVGLSRMQMWANKFTQMRAAGIEIPAPLDHSFDPADNRGFVVAARVKQVDTPKGPKNRLRLTYQVPGEEGVMLALRNRASIYVKPDVVDGTGRKWGEAIIHSAFTPYPVIHGMGEFLPFAASHGQATKGSPLMLAQYKGGPAMDPKMKAKLQALAVQNGKTVEEVAAMSDEELNTWGLGFLLSDEAAEGDAGAGAGAAGAGAGAGGGVNAGGNALAMSLLQTENTKLKTQVISLSQFAPRGAENDLVERMGLLGEKLETLVEKKRISPAQRDKFAALMKGKDNKPNHLVLSRIGESDKHLMGQIIDILSMDATTPNAGEQTGAQANGGTGLSLTDPKKDGAGAGGGAGAAAGVKKDGELTDSRRSELMGGLARRAKK